MRAYILLFVVCFSLPTLANKNIVIAGDNWCPINCQESEKNQGFMIDVAREALAQSGYTLTYMEMPWTRAIGLARKGEIHGIVGAFKGDAPDFHFPQFALLKISPSNLFVTTGSSLKYNNLRSLNGVMLGVIKGYDYGDELNNYIHSLLSAESSNINELYGNNAVARNIEFLLRKRIDVFVESAPVFWYQAQKLNVTNQVKEIGAVSKAEPCFIAFSPALALSEELALALDKGISLLKKNKQLEKFAKVYGLPPSTYDL